MSSYSYYLDILITLCANLLFTRKREKALTLATQLVESSMDQSNQEEFIDWVINQTLLIDDNLLSNSDQWAIFIHVVYQKCILLNDNNIESTSNISIFRLRFCVQKRLLLTDDSFEFLQLTRSLTKVIESLKDNNTAIKHENYRKLVKCILDCLEAAIRQYSKLWSRQPNDALFERAAFHRLLLEEDQRDRLDDLTNRITLLRRKGLSGVSSSSSGSSASLRLKSDNGSKDLHPLLNKSAHNVSMLK